MKGGTYGTLTNICFLQNNIFRGQNKHNYSDIFNKVGPNTFFSYKLLILYLNLETGKKMVDVTKVVFIYIWVSDWDEVKGPKLQD